MSSNTRVSQSGVMKLFRISLHEGRGVGVPVCQGDFRPAAVTVGVMTLVVV